MTKSKSSRSRRHKRDDADSLSPTHDDPLGLRGLWANGPPSTQEILQKVGQVPTPWGGVLGDEFANNSTVWERYTLGQHHQMVLEQNRRHFRTLPEGMDRPLMELTLALHDGGKAAALRSQGKQHQHRYTLDLLDGARAWLPVSPKALDRMKALVGGDPLGQLFTGRLALPQAADDVTARSTAAGMAPNAFLRLLTVYYQSDASSYTREAGGLPSPIEGAFALQADGLHLRFSREKGRLELSPGNEELLAALERRLV